MGGTKTRGIKPHKMGQVLPELQEAARLMQLKDPMSSYQKWKLKKFDKAE
jgi:hypothetical protein